MATPITWHYGGSHPHETKNDWQGTFSSPTEQASFEAVTTIINDGQFNQEYHLTAVSLPNVLSIGRDAFYNAPILYLNIPKAHPIGDRAFHSFAGTEEKEYFVYMRAEYISDAQQNRIFGRVLPPEILRYFGNWHYGDGNGGPHLYKNDWMGEFIDHYYHTADQIKAKFEAITTDINDDTFRYQKKLIGVSFPKVQHVGEYEFEEAPLQYINLPACLSIEEAFWRARGWWINAPNAVNIDSFTFGTAGRDRRAHATIRSKFKGDYAKEIFVNFWPLVHINYVEEPTTNWHYGDGHGGPHPTKNDWMGYFTSAAKQNAFEAITTGITDNSFSKEYGLVGVSLPSVTSISDFAFVQSKIKKLNLPKCVTIGEHAFAISPLTSLNIPAEDNVGVGAFEGIVNHPTTQVTFKSSLNTDSKKNIIFGAGNWQRIGFATLAEFTNDWHYGDGAGGPHATKNDWKGSFSSHDKQLEFEAITDHVDDHEFNAQEHLTAISLPNVEKLGIYSFFISKLTDIVLPKAYSIGDNSFFNTVNINLVKVKIGDMFDTDSEKDRIFGENGWQNINFEFIHNLLPANTIWWNGKIQDTRFEMDGKTVVKFIWNGKECVLKRTNPNLFVGTWSDPAKEQMFMEIEDEAPADDKDNPTKLSSETGITSITLPEVVTIGTNAFRNVVLTSLSIPKVVTINDRAFFKAELTSLDAPELTTAGYGIFAYSPITSLSIPKLQTIGDYGFWKAVITSLSLPECTSIGGYAFYNSRLTSLSLPVCTTIGPNAFQNSKLTTLSLPECTSIGDNSFYLSALTSVDLPKVQTIGEKAFEFAALTSLSLPECISIKSQAFFSTKLTSLSLPKVQTLEGFITNSKVLTSLDLPECTSIGGFAFSNSHLTSINMPKAVTIGDSSFQFIVNDPSTTVTMKSKFNTTAEKNRIFTGNWSKVTFNWVP